MPLAYCASALSKVANGCLSLIENVRSSIFLKPFGSTEDRLAAPAPGLLGLMIRCSEKMASSAVSFLPLWKVIPFFSFTVHTSAVAFGSIDWASRSCVV